MSQEGNKLSRACSDASDAFEQSLEAAGVSPSALIIIACGEVPDDEEPGIIFTRGVPNMSTAAAVIDDALTKWKAHEQRVKDSRH